MFHFIKKLEKEVLICVMLAAAVAAFTTEGFGAAGRSAMTAMAGTPAEDSREETAGERQESRDSAAKTENDNSLKIQEETSEYGKQVVGYLLTKEMKRQNETAQHIVQMVQEDAVRSVQTEGNRPAQGEEAGNAQEEMPLSAEKEKKERQISQKSKNSGISISPDDYQVLLKIVEAEAGICDTKGKILVANVILNRVKSEEFPDSVTEVVYQPSQFSPVSNGSINTCKVSSDTVESVDRALKGEDYSQGALFFMNRSASRSGSVRWFDGRLTFLFGHQGHEFFK